MKLIVSPHFQKKVSQFPQHLKEIIQTKLNLFFDNPKHPSLHSKKIQGTDGIFESRINDDIRITWEYQEDNIVLRNIGYHDPTLKNPRSNHRMHPFSCVVKGSCRKVEKGKAENPVI